ncbi:hypothetical protein [Scrofimicrobium sp. R131]|uniref:Primosomal protein N' 3' DNA-binding domain-containing protein n=1 Tax=Scrofimicrobium appendicitidis TaxID=3079930 RepID=A0AAU7V4C1_9ACTO
MIARVLIDLDVPHLDRPFDYSIPDSLLASVQVGSLVRVKWGNRRISGWVVELGETSTHEGELSPLLRVLSVQPLFTPAMLQTYRYLAARFAVNLSQVLSLAQPARRQKIEQLLAGATRPVRADWSPAAAVPEYGDWVELLASGPLPRAVVQTVPHRQFSALHALVAECARREIPVIVTAPTLAGAKEIHRRLSEAFSPEVIGLQASELPQTTRYEVQLRTLRGHYLAVVGTRSAIWAPFTKPALQVVWEDGSAHYRERRTPQVDVLDVAVARARWEGYGLVVASLDRSVKAEALVQSGWARSFVPSPTVVRAHTPRIQVVGTDEFEREGMAVLSTVPNAAYQAIRTGLSAGPVLVQVMGVGHFLVLACPACHVRPRCVSCGKLLELTGPPAEAVGHCAGCGATNSVARCLACGHPNLTVLEVGAERTARELGRAFPQTDVVISTSTTKIRRRIRPKPQLVVATAGAEPAVRGGYEAVVVLEASRLAYADRLGAEEEALRRWFYTFALARPGGQGVLSGDVPLEVERALVLWRPTEFAEAAWEERKEIGLYPARWIVALEGPAPAINDILTQLETLPLSPAEPGLQIFGYTPTETDEVRAIVACQAGQALSLMAHLKAMAVARSLRRGPKVKVVVNPPDLFGGTEGLR